MRYSYKTAHKRDGSDMGMSGTRRITVGSNLMTELKRRGYVRREMDRLTIMKALPRRLCFIRLEHITKSSDAA
jgi:hypothetical protein